MRVRTGFAFRNAYGHLDEVISRLKEIGWKHAPISDTTSTFGFNRWNKLAEKNGLLPIFGVELAVTPSPGEKKPPIDYWTFFATETLKPLHDLIGIATSKKVQGEKEEPYLLYSEALAHPGVIKIAGNRCLLDEMEKCPNLYIGLSPSTPIGLYKAAKKQRYKFVAVSDNNYPRETDRELYRVGLGWRSGTQSYPQHILSDDEWHQACENFALADRKLAISLRDKLLASCHAQLEKASLFVPEKKFSLREMCVHGALTKGVNLDDEVYSLRLDRELNMIADKKFEDYFFIIADIISWAKKQMIVGPARGSSCGSLVCYLLDITTIDPIAFNLIFERFIDINRSDLPDIDIDFSDTRRDRAFKYVEEKYGSDHVARLGTTGMFRPRSALNQVGKALRIPIWRITKVLESLIVRSGGDSRAEQQLEDTLKTTEAGRKLVEDFPAVLLGSRLEAHPSNSSQHAAGVCITKEPIDRYVAIDRRTNTAMCDKADAEDFNMLKIDMLGLTQLSIFERCLELLGQSTVSGWLEKLPLDDAAAFKVLNDRHYCGIFQFNGSVLQTLSKEIKFDHIEDLVAITALARPGPIASGGSNQWVLRRSGKKPVEYPHPIFEPLLKDTLGVVAYQEQVMQIGREVGDLSWEDVTMLRKAMSKSLGKEFFDQYGDRWKAAAAKKGIEQEILVKLWDDLCAYGSWAFNRAHAVAYGLVSYYCCYLKAHYPMEFAAATLDAEADPDRQIMVLREMKQEGIDYVAVDPETSDVRWTIAEKEGRQVLVGPLTMITGIGPAAMNDIIISRQTGAALRPGVAKKLERAKTKIDTIYPVADAVKKLHPDIKESLKIETEPTPIAEVQCGKKGTVVIFARVTKIAPKDEMEPVYVARRKQWGRPEILKGPTRVLHMFVRDDTDEIFCQIDRFSFEKLATKIVEEGRPGKSLYAIAGTVPGSFRMIKVNQVKYIGEIDHDD